MKHVFTTVGACEAWAEQTTTHGRGDGVNFPDMTEIKSYSTKIGARLEGRRFLIRYEYTSPTQTTLRHLRLLRSALNSQGDMVRVFEFPPSGNSKDPLWLDSELKRTSDKIWHLLSKADRCRKKFSAQGWCIAATELMRNFERLAEWADVPDLAKREFAPHRDELAMIQRRWEMKGQP